MKAGGKVERLVSKNEMGTRSEHKSTFSRVRGGRGVEKPPRPQRKGIKRRGDGRGKKTNLLNRVTLIRI